jgi:peptide/nickel transport system substrate-binding protein
VWRFKLRPAVKFQDGTLFSADDVLFSFDRVRDPGSNLKSAVATVKEVRKVDDLTVDMVTNGPDPILPEEIAVWNIMSKSWCEKNDAAHPADLARNEESYATSHANGTGPFMLKVREPDVKTELVNNPDWWDKPQHNLTDVIFEHIQSPAARVAALLSGELDMIYSVPPQDTDRIANAKGLRIIQGPELRTIFLGFDQSRPELTQSDVKGRNPFKDKRVRQAFYQAIDEEAIKTKVMRGYATPTALMVAAGINGFSEELNQRFPFDREAAKKLLGDAGYPNGFTVDLDCPNDRYINDEQICNALATMLGRIGVTVKPIIQPRIKFFAKVLSPKFDTSFYLLGWTPATYDAQNMLINLVHSRDAAIHAGDINLGGYSNPAIDALIEAIQVETDAKKRLEEMHAALKMVKDDFAYIPLHQQVLVWAAKANIELVQPADDHFPLRFVNVK